MKFLVFLMMSALGVAGSGAHAAEKGSDVALAGRDSAASAALSLFQLGLDESRDVDRILALHVGNSCNQTGLKDSCDAIVAKYHIVHNSYVQKEKLIVLHVNQDLEKRAEHLASLGDNESIEVLARVRSAWNQIDSQLKANHDYLVGTGKDAVDLSFVADSGALGRKTYLLMRITGEHAVEDGQTYYDFAQAAAKIVDTH